MTIATITKRVTKAQAIIDLKKQLKDALNMANSVVLNANAVIDSIKNDPDFTLDEVQEYVNIIIYALNEAQRKRKSWQQIFDDINLG